MFLYYKTGRFHVTLCLFSNGSQKTSRYAVRTSVTYSANGSCAIFLFLQHFDVICDLLLNRCAATWNLFVIEIQKYKWKFGTTTNVEGTRAEMSRSTTYF